MERSSDDEVSSILHHAGTSGSWSKWANHEYKEPTIDEGKYHYGKMTDGVKTECNPVPLNSGLLMHPWET